jgi:GNAT superfamily N-acetyltransferase
MSVQIHAASAPFTLRRADAGDADAIASVYYNSERSLTFVPMFHTLAEYRRNIADAVLRQCEVTVAEDASGVVAFLARRSGDIPLLYVRPDRVGMGAGTQLIEAAKASELVALELWCLQANERALRFYEARGFVAIRFTDGANNKARMPDIRYRWEPPWALYFLIAAHV